MHIDLLMMTNVSYEKGMNIITLVPKNSQIDLGRLNNELVLFDPEKLKGDGRRKTSRHQIESDTDYAEIY